MAIAAGIHRPATKQAIEAIQKARNGRSDSSEFAVNDERRRGQKQQRGPQRMRRKRLANAHMASAAITENRI